jgi:NlpC/P60 family putative phage cell wall peptidase
MMAHPDLIVLEARAWIGTPYVHQASAKGAGADCLGLLRGVWRQVKGPEPEQVPAYSRDWSEPQGEERLWEAALRHLRPKAIGYEAPGDVLLFRMRNGAVAKHLGIAGRVGDAPSFIHAYSNHGVVESPLSMPWRRRVVARFEFPEEAS